MFVIVLFFYVCNSSKLTKLAFTENSLWKEKQKEIVEGLPGQMVE